MENDIEIQMLGVREVFQLVEDALLNAGLDELVVATDHGLFTWKHGRFPDRFVVQQQDGTVVVYRDGVHSRYTTEQWEVLKAKLKD
jgi:hypothetical protein